MKQLIVPISSFLLAQRQNMNFLLFDSVFEYSCASKQKTDRLRLTLRRSVVSSTLFLLGILFSDFFLSSCVEATLPCNAPPAAVPVVTAEEAEKLNEEAIVEFDRTEKERRRLERGYVVAFIEKFEEYKPISLTKPNDDLLKKNDYDVDEFKRREIPSAWTIDYSTIPADTSFQKTDDGYSIVSPQGNIRFVGKRFNGMRNSFLIELTVKNLSEQESEITLGVHDSGIIKQGYKPLATEKIKGNEEKTIEVELSVFEQLANISPAISIKGAITLTALKMYRKDHDDFTIVEGEIVERSKLPDPESTDYPDCRYTAHFVGNAILSGMPCNKELVLSIDGFLNKKVLPTNTLKQGDKIQCAIVPVDSLPEELASIQESDDLSLFTLDSYLVTTYSKISKYTDSIENINPLVPFKSDNFEFISVFNRGFNPPIPERLKDAQRKKIQTDLEEANKMIAFIEENKDDIEQRFQDVWAKEKERFPNGFNTIASENGNVSFYWRNVDNSFWCLPPNYTFVPKNPYEISKDKIDAVVEFKNFLESNGIQLIVSLIPDQYVVSSRIINPDLRNVPDLQTAICVKQLSEAGVECPYELTKILENYNRFQFAFFYPFDYHPSETTQYAVANEISDRLSRYDFYPKLDSSSFTTQQSMSGYDFARLPANCDIGDNIANTQRFFNIICYNGEPVKKDPSSEILVWGNSFIYTPGSQNGQHSFQAFLTERMLYPIDEYIAVAQGPMTTAIQRVFERPETLLKGKKVVILQMSVTHVNNSGVIWKNIATMDKKKIMLNGKKLVDTLSISGNGDYATDIVQDHARDLWKQFEEKKDIKCFTDEKFEIVNQVLLHVDASKPLICVVQTARFPLLGVPSLFVNGSEEKIPATQDLNSIYWQDVYFNLPAGTTQLKIDLQGKAKTLIGFNKVLIYQ